MAYYIFLKSLRSLEEFRKNPHVKIPPKSPSTNFQSLDKFKNPILIWKFIFSDFQPGRPRGPPGLSAQPAHWPHRPPQAESARPARPARASVASSRKIRFPFQITPSRAGRLLPLSPPRGPTCRLHRLHRAGRPRSGFSPCRRSPAPLPRSSDAPEHLQPSLITSPS
jgi:hypothetical protein